MNALALPIPHVLPKVRMTGTAGEPVWVRRGEHPGLPGPAKWLGVDLEHVRPSVRSLGSEPAVRRETLTL